jgi:mRNA-degrading endonuclease toxin of MazEF toxin-antitoxin module
MAGPPIPPPAAPSQPNLKREDRKKPDGTPTVLIHGIKRGMIIWGDVPAGQPWLVVSRDDIHQRLPIVLAVPITSQLQKADGETFRKFRIRILQKDITHYAITGTDVALQAEDQLALTEQERSMSHDRLLGNPVAFVTPQALYAVEAGLKYVMYMG